MNVLRVRARNYRTFETLDLELPEGVTAIVGENGAGKSSIVNIVDIALFAGRGELPDLVTTGEDTMEITLDFEHDGQLYRARRGCRKGKASFDLERASREVLGEDEAEPWDTWEPLSGASADATQEILEGILGMNRVTFRASAFLRQGDGASFNGAKPSDRRDVLAQILGLGAWDQMLASARTDLRKVEDDQVAVRATVEIAEHAVAEKATVASGLSAARLDEGTMAAAVTGTEAELERATLLVASHEAAKERERACNGEAAETSRAVTAAEAAVAESEQAGVDRAARQAELNEIAPLADSVPEVEARVNELRVMAARVTEALAERAGHEHRAAAHATEASSLESHVLDRERNAAALTAKAVELRGTHDAKECDRCGTHLVDDARARAAASYDAEAAELLKSRNELAVEAVRLRTLEVAAREASGAVAVPEVVDPEPVERELARARAASERRAGLMPILQRCAEVAVMLPFRQETLIASIATLAEKERALDEARGQVVDTTEMEQKIAHLRSELVRQRTALDGHRATIARHEAMLEQIAKAEHALAETAVARENLAKRAHVLTLAVRAYSGTGVPALIVESSAIPKIEDEANRILRELDTWYRVELRTQRQKKDGGLAESLDIIIHDGTGDRPYETYSGGERTRLNVALQISLAGLLANRRGSESRFLALDEPEFLDERGITSLVDVLHGLTGTFTRIQLVTHHPAGAGACDQQIRVVKNDDRSHIVPDIREAVAA